ncbi:hypothetical protein [Mycolicibacterium doricum]|uniref:hypothetical protein n=1 Tax=Mycolicibacterium doricum TaxID=126673 RepID=UPI0013CF41DF|nr:hypothetical protein [Mycolicibacterium doricum]MCV7268430.1 hypothetical protein [Mycolicibacterium doricum]
MSTSQVVIEDADPARTLGGLHTGCRPGRPCDPGRPRTEANSALFKTFGADLASAVAAAVDAASTAG